MSSSDPQNIHNWHLIVRGDTRAFADFVDQYKNLVTSIAYSATGDLGGSEDIAQETFLVAWQSRRDLNEPGKVVSWLGSITRNLAKQWVRKRSAKSWAAGGLDETNIAHEQAPPVERMVADEEQQLVWSTLETIPENYREVLVLYYRESHSIADVALALDITEEAARQRLSRGRNLLRAEVERTIEVALAKSRPSAAFTSGVITLIAAGSVSTVSKTATAATVSFIGNTAAPSTLLGASQVVATGTVIGAAGGLLGALGGLGGAWLGNRVPQLMAPTMTERRLLEREGRVIFRLALLLTAASLITIPLAILWADQPNAVLIAVLVNLIMAVCFAGACIVRGLRLNKQIQHIRQTVTPEQDPNPTWLKDRLGMGLNNAKARWVGRKFTSRQRLLGWPLIEFRVSDPGACTSSSQALHAKGWIAIGDKATGLVAIGGIARGALAIGGLALGLVSLGGFSVGLLSIGGAALGGLSLGGLAVGHSAIGGGAVGWQAAGGGAVGVYSANGGFAAAGHIAEGGFAISLKYAVGGEARAPEANTPAAREACARSWVAKVLDTDAIVKKPDEFRRNAMIYGTLLPVAFSVIMALLVPLLMYRRQSTIGPGSMPVE